jgi:hAT family C-terminal dimerisation region
MKFDYKDDEMLSEYLESSKQNLYEYYETHYAGKHSARSQGTNPVTMPAISHNTLAPPHSPQKDFTSRFQRKEKVAINELDEFFKLPQEHFGTCNPIHWWIGRRAQFPNLFWLARDILCIPGSHTQLLFGVLQLTLLL